MADANRQRLTTAVAVLFGLTVVSSALLFWAYWLAPAGSVDLRAFRYPGAFFGVVGPAVLWLMWSGRSTVALAIVAVHSGIMTAFVARYLGATAATATAAAYLAACAIAASVAKRAPGRISSPGDGVA